MGQMADGSRYPVMLPVIQHQRDCSHSLSHCQQTADVVRIGCRGLCQAFWRGHNIIGIFQKMICRMFIACFFGSGHGMASHKTVGKALAQDFFMDICFGAPYICDQCSRF